MITGKNYKLNAAAKEEKRIDLNALRDMTEENLLGGYTMIFPLEETRANEY
jgi:hypothetical protein